MDVLGIDGWGSLHCWKNVCAVFMVVWSGLLRVESADKKFSSLLGLMSFKERTQS